MFEAPGTNLLPGQKTGGKEKWDLGRNESWWKDRRQGKAKSQGPGEWPWGEAERRILGISGGAKQATKSRAFFSKIKKGKNPGRGREERKIESTKPVKSIRPALTEGKKGGGGSRKLLETSRRIFDKFSKKKGGAQSTEQGNGG